MFSSCFQETGDRKHFCFKKMLLEKKLLISLFLSLLLTQSLALMLFHLLPLFQTNRAGTYQKAGTGKRPEKRMDEFVCKCVGFY